MIVSEVEMNMFYSYSEINVFQFEINRFKRKYFSIIASDIFVEREKRKEVGSQARFQDGGFL